MPYLRYVKWSLAYELPDAYRFWDALEEALKAVAAEDVQFTNGLRKTDLRDLGKSSLNASDIGKAFVNVAKRIRKHLPQNEGLARQVRASDFCWFWYSWTCVFEKHCMFCACVCCAVLRILLHVLS